MTTATVFSDNGRTYQVVNTGEDVIVSQVFIPSAPTMPEKRMTHGERVWRQMEAMKMLRKGAKPQAVADKFGFSVSWAYELKRRLTP